MSKSIKRDPIIVFTLSNVIKSGNTKIGNKKRKKKEKKEKKKNKKREKNIGRTSML